MLTLSAAGKSTDDIEKLIQESLDSAADDEELKILIDGPAQAASITKILESHGFKDVMPEDDDGLLFLIAAKKKVEIPQEQEETPQAQETQPQPEKIPVIPNSAGVLVAAKYKAAFVQRMIASMSEGKSRPDVIGLMNSGVTLAAYSSPTCEALRKMEGEGVRVLVSEPCADRLGVSEALGAGVLSDMSSIIDAVFACEKVVSL